MDTQTLANQLSSLIRHLLPNSLHQDQYLSYVLRVLSSRVTTLPEMTEQKLIDRIKKRVAGVNSKKGGSDPLWKLQIQLERLFASKATTKQFSILYCLYSLSEDSLSAYLEPAIPNAKTTEGETEPMITEAIESTKELKVLPTKRAGNISEDDLLRSLLYIFQGIDGNHISYSVLDESYTIAPRVAMAEGSKEMTLRLCEVGWVYKRVAGYLQDRMNSMREGQVVQSFCSAIQSELNEYFKMLTMLEKQLQENSKQTPDKRLDLIKLNAWMQTPLEQLKHLAIICDTAQSTSR
eukprot:TRINITY_DN2670_c0_g1_i4.p1 TRINITY_DN2670_c0_g1~~TRINITY_DN2670_c0_g1_i4.p1  ORF type:complete len:293 (-),score=54.70 TRINITY_DN2670_c0_g1_i4:158-1036(-)